VNRQVYKVGESLNQIQLCHFVQSKKLQLENSKELIQFLHILCIMFKIIAFFIIKLFAWLHVRVGILLTTANNCMTASFHLEGRVWAHNTSLALPLFIEVPVPSQESRRPYIYIYAGADPGFQVRGAHLKKLRRAEGGAKIFGVFRVKNHDFTPKNHIFFNCRGRRENV
jgi:hypothetical protein